MHNKRETLHILQIFIWQEGGGGGAAFSMGEGVGSVSSLKTRAEDKKRKDSDDGSTVRDSFCRARNIVRVVFRGNKRDLRWGCEKLVFVVLFRVGAEVKLTHR